ncbi:MAG: Gfo/Idh/MocA family oxidoreductase [Nanoarchaeota archaeon]
MNFLICGFGNIGQRHFRNLKQLQPNCKINVYTKAKADFRIFDNELNISYTNDLKKVYNINKVYHDLEEALLNKYDAGFVCSLPPNRIDIAIKCAKKGINLFIEKPLSNNLDEIYMLQDIVEKNKLKCALGFQMRFHPIIQKIQGKIWNEEFGHIYRIEINHCNSIYNWTKGRKDLKDFYGLKKETGGGVLLSQIHEIDYSFYLFGKYYPISAIYGNILGFEVEDNISIMSNLENDGRCTPIIINLDFISSIPKREISIYGTKKIEIFDLLLVNSIEWNNLFIEEMKVFISSLNNGCQFPLATLEEGISSLEYVMDIKDNFIKI